METCRNRDRLNTLIQKLWSPRKHGAIQKHKSPEHLFQSPEKPVGVWPPNSTAFGAHTCRQGEFTCAVSCRKLWTNISIFWRWLPTADCCFGAMREQWSGAKHGLAYPAVGVTASGTAQHWSSSATSRSVSHLFCQGPGESRWAVRCIQHWEGSLCRVDNCARIWLRGRTRESYSPYRWALLTCEILASQLQFDPILVLICTFSFYFHAVLVKY